MLWFLACLDGAFDGAEIALASVLDRQRLALNRLLGDFDDLIARGILVKAPGGGRSTSYALAPVA